MNNQEIIFMEDKFKKNFQPHDYFWGLGIENETYLKCSYPKFYNGEFIQKNIKRERYSVNYLENYQSNYFSKLLELGFEKDKMYMIHQMLNAHCFDKMDKFGNHKTLFTKKGELNPKFTGKTILEEWQEFDPWFKENVSPFDKHDKNIFFDGDTIEFITENFYKCNVKEIIKELEERRNQFLDHLEIFREKYNIWSELGPLSFPSFNPGLNQFQTQLDRITIFNNGTYHIHITLPTRLNEEGEIENKEDFEKRHKILGNIIQWLEPFYISLYGSPDIFAVLLENLKEEDKKQFPENFYYAGGSLRCLMSRYIGVGTYPIHNEKLKKGKYVKVKKEEIEKDQNKFWWRYAVERESGYYFEEKKEDKNEKMDMGFDLNMMKHYQSGIEIRFLDSFSPKYLYSFLYSLFLLIEDLWHSFSNNLENSNKKNKFVFESEEWNNLVVRVLKEGYKTEFKTKEEKEFWTFFFEIEENDKIILNEKNNICEWFMEIVEIKRKKYIEGNRWLKTQFLKYFIKDKKELEQPFYLGEVNRWHYFEHKKQLTNLMGNFTNYIEKDIISDEFLTNFKEMSELFKKNMEEMKENMFEKERKRIEEIEKWKQWIEKRIEDQKREMLERELNMHKKTVEVLYTMFLPHFQEMDKKFQNLNDKILKIENKFPKKNEIEIERKKKCFF